MVGLLQNQETDNVPDDAVFSTGTVTVCQAVRAVAMLVGVNVRVSIVVSA